MSKLFINGYEIDASITDILEKVRTVISNGKLKDYTQKPAYVMVTCPFHKDGLEDKPSCGITSTTSGELEYGTFHCFTCGEKGTLVHFIASCFEKSDEFAKKWLINNFGKLRSDNSIVQELEEINLYKKEIKPKEFKYNFSKCESFHPYMNKRKLNTEVCKKFKVMYEKSTNSLIFPVWDENGKLVSITRRNVSHKQFILESNKDKPVYLLNFIKEENTNTVYVCESQINALTLWGWGYKAVALFGTGSAHQYEILNNSEIKHYVLCLDGDEAGHKGTLRFIKNIRKDVFIDIVKIPKGRDVNDLTKQEFENLEIISSTEYK